MGKVVFSPDERKAAYVIGDAIRLCDLKTGDELMTFRGHSGRIWGLHSGRAGDDSYPRAGTTKQSAPGTWRPERKSTTPRPGMWGPWLSFPMVSGCLRALGGKSAFGIWRRAWSSADLILQMDTAAHLPFLRTGAVRFSGGIF